MKRQIFFFFLSVLIRSNITFAQKNWIEVSIGFRDETVKNQILNGVLQHISDAKPLAEVSIVREMNEKWFLRSGIGVQRYGNRTTIENGIDIATQLNWQTLPMFYIGTDRKILKGKRLDFNLGVNQQALFISNNEEVLDFSFFNSKDLSADNSKNETVKSFRFLNLRTQLSAQLNWKLKNNKYLFLNYSYNQGWANLLERTVAYKFNSKSGEGVFTTKGSGFQVKFGFAFPM